VDTNLIYVIIACTIGFLVAWGVGANDLANIMSTSMGSKAISARQAIIIAITFEFAGAFFGGIHVTQTIRSGIINTTQLIGRPEILIDGMLATLLSGMVWILLASYFGMPVSITNSIIGGIVGFGVIVLGVHAVYWHTIGYIAISWLFSPLAAGTLAFVLFVLIKKLILAASNPTIQAFIYLPILFFLVGLVVAAVIILKDLYAFHYSITPQQRLFIVLGTGFMISLLGSWLRHHVKVPKDPT